VITRVARELTGFGVNGNSVVGAAFTKPGDKLTSLFDTVDKL
jgi:hypothetical protein